jgi:hypothetical protein
MMMDVIEKWHFLEETYGCGMLTINFENRTSIVIDNNNAQRYLTCYVDGTNITYTHIESFVFDFASVLSAMTSLCVSKITISRKRKFKYNMNLSHKKQK